MLFRSASTGSVTTAYSADVIAFAAMVIAMYRLPALPPLTGAPTRAGLASVRDGMLFLRGKRTLQMSFYADIIAMVFGMPRALFPAIAAHWYGDSMGSTAARVGLLTAAPALGAALSALFSGPLTTIYRHGRAIVWAIVAWGCAIAVFGILNNLWLALIALVIAGAADNVSALYRITMVQIGRAHV